MPFLNALSEIDMTGTSGLAMIAGLLALVFFTFCVLLVKQYKRCPSNRILVIYDGRIVGELPPTASDEELGLMMTGSGRPQA